MPTFCVYRTKMDTPFNENCCLGPGTRTSALLDRLLHHAESVVIEGRSYRMRDQTDA